MKVPEIQTLDDFKCYLLTYVAEANFSISEEEKDIIFHHVTADRYEHIKRFIDTRSDYENLEIITAYKDKFLTDEATKQELFDEMNMIYKADKHPSVLERNMILSLKKLLK